MTCKKLSTLLDSHSVHYDTIPHSVAYTALQTAQAAHIPSQELAKTVMVKVGDKLCMVVIPASHRLDFERLKVALGTDKVELASEWEFNLHFPDCELGAMPPFGNLYNVDTFVDDILAEDKEIAFNSGTHTEIIKLSFEDYADLAHPSFISLTK